MRSLADADSASFAAAGAGEASPDQPRSQVTSHGSLISSFLFPCYQHFRHHALLFVSARSRPPWNRSKPPRHLTQDSSGLAGKVTQALYCISISPHIYVYIYIHILIYIYICVHTYITSIAVYVYICIYRCITAPPFLRSPGLHLLWISQGDVLQNLCQHPTMNAHIVTSAKEPSRIHMHLFKSHDLPTWHASCASYGQSAQGCVKVPPASQMCVYAMPHMPNSWPGARVIAFHPAFSAQGAKKHPLPTGRRCSLVPLVQATAAHFRLPIAAL